MHPTMREGINGPGGLGFLSVFEIRLIRLAESIQLYVVTRATLRPFELDIAISIREHGGPALFAVDAGKTPHRPLGVERRG